MHQIEFSRCAALAALMLFIGGMCCWSVSAAPPEGYHLVWQDEFEGDAMNTSKWQHRLLGARQLGYTVEEAVGVADGKLSIKTWSDWNGTEWVHKSGMISTRETFEKQYGYFEASMDFNGASGMWSAFWLTSRTMQDTSLPPEQAGVELDVVESRWSDAGGNDIRGTASLNTHWGGYNEFHQTRGHNTPDLGLDNGFHTYAIEWSPEGYRFYIDGVFQWDGADTPTSQVAQYMLLSSEVGAAWSGAIPSGGYGSFEDSNVSMVVDWVRVYSTSPIPEPGALSLLALAAPLMLRRRGLRS